MPALALVTLMLACDSDPAAPSRGADPEIRLHVTGGVAGVDYTIVADGRSGDALGESCVNGCAFEPGETVASPGTDVIEDWASRLVGAGILDLDGTDYGNECCDRFQVVLTYADRLSESTVRGTADLMPDEIQVVVNQLMGLVQGTFPLLIDWDADPARLPADPVTLGAVRLSGLLLELDLGYSGGCEQHVFTARAYGGFMESFPVQVNVAVSHDGHDDPCDAFLHETVTFDLWPLAREYEAAYPGEAPGERRVIAHLHFPGVEGSLELPIDF